MSHERTYTAKEIADLGEALNPHIQQAVDSAVKPLVDRFDSLDRRARWWGAVGGALPGILAWLGGLLHGR